MEKNEGVGGERVAAWNMVIAYYITYAVIFTIILFGSLVERERETKESIMAKGLNKSFIWALYGELKKNNSKTRFE